MDITLPYVRKREGESRAGRGKGPVRVKNLFAAVSVNKYMGVETETDAA